MRGIIFILLILAGLTVLFASCSLVEGGAGAARPQGPDFDHAGHLARGLECADCHGEKEARWKAMPKLSMCMECHAEIDGDKPPEKGAAVFFDANKEGRWLHVTALPSEVIFDHGTHTNKYTACLDCHKQVAKSKTLPQDARPNMQECMACHEIKARDKLVCAACHKVIRQDRRPASHKPSWIREHGRRARLGDFADLPEQCSLCHTRSSCDSCHRAEKPRSHNNLWRFRGHATMASLDRNRCSVCHTTSSCTECHRKALPRSHRGAWGSPFNRHCTSCHLPLGGFEEEGCSVCHRDAPGHDSAPARPGNPIHMTNDPAACRACHTPEPHPDNGQSCLLCHR